MMENFEVIDFRFAKISDEYDLLYNQEGAWSRIYEYPYVVNFILTEKRVLRPKIHNSSWGFEGIHIQFKKYLNRIGECVHSDIRVPISEDEYQYDITTEDIGLVNKFDFVINISTIEHLDNGKVRTKAVENLFNQLVVGGYLILTFDYPRVDLEEIEKLIGVKCKNDDVILNGKNSINPNLKYENLNIVYLILKKNG